jgi:hypothetical protein
MLWDHAPVKAILRSVLPAVVILAVVAAAALLVTRAAPDQPPSQPWSPPAGFEEVGSVQRADGNRVSLWLGRIGPPKPDGCWYVVHRTADGDIALGACGGEPRQPWVVLFEGIVAGGTGEDAARWVRIGGGSPIAVTQGHFIAVGGPGGRTTSVELLDEDQTTLASFPEVFVSGNDG